MEIARNEMMRDKPMLCIGRLFYVVVCANERGLPINKLWICTL